MEIEQKVECLTWHGRVVFAKDFVFRFIRVENEKVRKVV